MKKHLQLLTALIVISFFTSCSIEDINKNTNILGVWESSDLSTNSTETQTLAFGDNNTGLNIQTSVSNSSESISSATSFKWEANDEIITLLEDNISETFIINSEGQLVLANSQDLRLEKVSEDYSKYY